MANETDLEFYQECIGCDVEELALVINRLLQKQGRSIRVSSRIRKTPHYVSSPQHEIKMGAGDPVFYQILVIAQNQPEADTLVRECHHIFSSQLRYNYLRDKTKKHRRAAEFVGWRRNTPFLLEITTERLNPHKRLKKKK